MTNPIRPLEGLSSPPRLFAGLCGHMVVLGTVLATIALADAVTRLLGWESGWAFILAFIAAVVAAAFILGKGAVAFMDRWLPLVDRLLPTPSTLQRGYVRLVERGEDDGSWVSFSAWLLMGFAGAVSVGMVGTFRLLGSIREDPFIITSIALCILAVVFAAILVVASYLVGRSFERHGRG